MRFLAALCLLLAGTSTFLLLRRPAAVLVPVPMPVVVAGPAASPGAVTEEASGGRAAAIVGVMARAMSGASSAPAAGTDEQRPGRDFESRRERRQQWLREMLGRAEGETDQAYRERVAPMIELALSRPRQRVEERRAEFEAAAELTEEQRAEFDQALTDARAELVGVASQAITVGDLTPYRRNTAGVLRTVGVAAGVLDGFDARVRGTLRPDQASLLDQTGFDLIEYIGFTTPWETLAPPPPPVPEQL